MNPSSVLVPRSDAELLFTVAVITVAIAVSLLALIVILPPLVRETWAWCREQLRRPTDTNPDAPLVTDHEAVALRRAQTEMRRRVLHH